MNNTQKCSVTPEIALIAITRVALGVGIGLLLSRRLGSQARTATGLALLAVGVATTVPLAVEVFGGFSENKEVRGPAVAKHTA